MWAKVNAATVAQENLVNLMSIDMMQLNVLQTQLDNVSMQAVLIIGFALSMWGGETLDPLSDDTGPHCIFKTGTRSLVAIIFFASVGLCITHSFIAVVISLFIKQASQASALLVSPGATVANTRRHMGFIYNCFVRAIAFFLSSATLLLWLFVGLPSRIHFDIPEEAHDIDWEDGDGVTRMYNGEHTITCMDRFSPDANAARNLLTFSIAALNTLILASMGTWGYYRFNAVRASYEPLALLEWWSQHKAEQARQHEILRQKQSHRHGHATFGDAAATRDSLRDSAYLPPPVSLHGDNIYEWNTAQDSDADSTEDDGAVSTREKSRASQLRSGGGRR